MAYDKRKNRRQSLSYKAMLTSADGSWSQTCELVDVSQAGARLVIDEAASLPDEFFLVLGQERGPNRGCRLIWRGNGEIGVRFTAPKPDVEKAA